MAALLHQSLTNCQAMPLSSRFAPAQRPGPFARVAATLRQWRRNARERRELAALAERDLRDMRVSSADVWNEVRQPFWRTTRPF
jgi:uncharacterized protein YjiS (DUF1127 family)